MLINYEKKNQSKSWIHFLLSFIRQEVIFQISQLMLKENKISIKSVDHKLICESIKLIENT